jgi:hypothetical protein
MRSKEAGSVPQSTNVIQLKLSSLIVLAISVIVTTAACTAIIAFGVTRGTPPTGTVGFGQPSPLNAATDDPNPPWGELVKLDLDVEQPDEYVAFEPLTNLPRKFAPCCKPSASPPPKLTSPAAQPMSARKPARPFSIRPLI